MTLKEAKKILEKEGFFLVKVSKGFEFSELPVWEKQEVVEAKRVVNENDFATAMGENEWFDRQERLKKEYEENTKAPGSAENHIKEDSGVNPALKESASQFNDALLDEQAKEIDKQNQEITRLLSLVEKKENSISRLHYEKSVLEKENEELKKGEIPARYFDKALVDEQSEKIKKLEHEKLDILEMASSCKQTIAELTKEKTNLEDQITILNACKEHNENVGRKQIKRLGKEIAKLNGIIHDKNAILSDVAEELRLSKIREKNLTEVSQKYMKENEELKKELADNVVDKIDAQSLKSAESALAWKEKVVTYKDMALAYYEKKIAEKDEVIADLGKELEAKHKEYVWYKGAYDGAQQILDTIADYAAKHPDKKFSDQMVGVDKAEEGGDHSAKVILCGKDVVKKFKENEESVFDFFKRHKETAEELYEVADEAFEQLLLFGEVIIKSEK